MTKTTKSVAQLEKEIKQLKEERRNLAEHNYTMLCQTMKDWNYDDYEIREGIDLLIALCNEVGVEFDCVMSDITSIEFEYLIMRANRIGGYSDATTEKEAIRRLFARGLNVVNEPIKYNRAIDLQTGEVVSATFAECLEAIWAWATYELKFNKPLPEEMNIKQTRTDEGKLLFNVDGLEYAIEFDPVSEH